MSRWVLDASSTAAYLLGEGTADERRAVLGEAHAPNLIDVEVTQTFRGLVRGGKIPLTIAEQGRSDLRALRLRRHPEWPLLRRAWELRDVCTTYDAVYVALAEALDATLVTRDARLGRSTRSLVDITVCR